MKPYFLLAIVLVPLLHAIDPYSPDPTAVDSDALLMKPLTGISDCTSKPLAHGSSKRWGDPSLAGEREECIQKPEKCVITTYSIPEPGGPEHSLSNIKTIIDYDPATGKGKVYAADMFGKTLQGQVGVVKKQFYSDRLIVYPSDNFGNADYSKPSQVIEGVRQPDLISRSGQCGRTDYEYTTSGNIKIYEADNLGSRSLFAEPLGNAKVECEK